MKKMKLFTTFLVAVMLGVVVVGCGSKKESKVKELKTTMSMDIDSLNPFKMVSSGTEEIMMNVFEGLFMPSPKGELIPAIASSYTVSEDGKTYVFKIRQGIKFHNGNPLDVKDVEFSLKRMAGMDGNPPSSALFKDIESIEIVGDDEIKLTIKKPNSAFLFSLTEGIVPDENAETLDTNPIGTGAYKVKEYTREQQIVFEKFEDYWGDKGKIDEVTVYITPNGDTSMLKLLSGEINFLNKIDSKRKNELKDFNNVSAPLNTVQIFALNNAVKPFDDVRVRRAINLAINKDDIIDSVAGGAGTKLDTNMSPVMGKYAIPLLPQKQDIEEAKRLLQEAGVENLTFTIKAPSNYPLHVNTAQIIAEQLKKIGVNVKIESIEWTTWLSDVYSGRKYEGTIVGLSGKLDPYSILRRYTSDYKNNFFNFKNEEYDRLINEAKEMTEDEKITANYKRAQEILRSEQAAIYIMDPELITALDKKITGYETYPLPFIHFASMDIGD